MVVKKAEEAPEQQGYIDELAQALGMGGAPAGSEEVTQAPSTEAPVPETEVPSTEVPATEPPDEEEEFTTAPPDVEDEDEEFEEEEVVELSASQFNKLITRMNSLAKQVQDNSGALPAAPPPPAEAKVKEPVKVSLPDLQELLLSADELDMVADDPKLINKALERVYNAFKPIAEVAERLPGEVESTVNELLSVKDIATQFYKDNPDIAKSPRVQAMVQQEFRDRSAAMQAAGTPIDGSELLNTIASDVREELGWKAPAKSGKPAPKKGEGKKVTVMGEELDAVIKKRKVKKQKPTLPGAGGGRKPKKKVVKRKGQAALIDELLDDLGDKL